MNFSHSSLRAGNGAIACTSRSIGTSPTMAIVAACRKSATSGPTNVAPTSSSRSVSTTNRVVPPALRP